ncbi:hypothetical protein NIES4071_36260 [Calothrix sp. NIES-4071]|nr:hypothetical protein NIES4071_36260 [Calothrix sp. NIES-4071]BAZ57945.1 hypothetical protein NIES4105_36190 [Calothrix sp. NIES-4105]
MELSMENKNLNRVNFIDLTLPKLQDFDKFLGWMVGRILFSTWFFTLWSIKTTAKLIVTITEQAERATHNLLRVYEQLPHMGMVASQVVDTTATLLTAELENVITNLVDAIKDKHLIIVGDTGTGKSFIAQYLAYSVGGTVKVYDPDASPDEWVGLNVVGRRGNFEAINQEMSNDLTELERRIDLRGEHGDKVLAGLDTVLIAEEFPLLRDSVEIASEWFLKHGRRGRKPKQFIIALSQDDTVKSFGIEGEGGVRKGFKMLRLGKFAVTHAKQLKDTQIEQWLKTGKYRCMLDDYPCQLPDLSSFKMFTPRLAIPTPNLPLTTVEPELSVVDDTLKKAAKACLEAGLSDSHIIKEVLNFKGSKYNEGKTLLDSVKRAT